MRPVWSESIKRFHYYFEATKHAKNRNSGFALKDMLFTLKTNIMNSVYPCALYLPLYFLFLIL